MDGMGGLKELMEQPKGKGGQLKLISGVLNQRD